MSPMRSKNPGAYALALVLCTARVCEHDATAQRAELRALVGLHERYEDMADAFHRLPTIKRPTGDPEQDRCLALLLDDHTPNDRPSQTDP
jgi:hypothetical protein